jgi:hypothetical protein
MFLDFWAYIGLYIDFGFSSLLRIYFDFEFLSL